MHFCSKLICSISFNLQILHDLLAPACDNVKVGLRETTHSTSFHLRSKTLVSDGQNPDQQTQLQAQHQSVLNTQAASAHLPSKSSEVCLSP